MSARAWLAGAALLGATLAVSPVWVAQAQDAGEEKPAADSTEKTSEYSSAQEVLGSLQGLTKDWKNPRNPSEEEIAGFFASAFPRCADYLDANKEAKDADLIYNWAGRRAAYAYGNEGFVRIANSYMAAKPEAEDLKTWKDAALFARLGIEADAEAAKKELVDLEKAAKDDPSRRLELADIWLRYFDKQSDSEGKSKLIEKLKTDESFTKSEDEWVQRRLMRTIFANSDKQEITDGEAFPDWASVMTVNALDGKPISVADYKGKVILIDFWAVWCGPCMGEMPNVIKLYEETHETGFEVIGISLDNESGKFDLEALKSTIAGKGRVSEMPWRQIYDGGGWSSGLAKYYGVRSIPKTVLIDQSGTVVAQGLRGEELASKVKELLAKDAAEEGADK